MYIITAQSIRGVRVLDTKDGVEEPLPTDIYQTYKKRGIKFIGGDRKLYNPQTCEMTAVLIEDDGRTVVLVGYREIQVYVDEKRWCKIPLQYDCLDCQVMVNQPRTEMMMFVKTKDGAADCYKGGYNSVKLATSTRGVDRYE